MIDIFSSIPTRAMRYWEKCPNRPMQRLWVGIILEVSDLNHLATHVSWIS